MIAVALKRLHLNLLSARFWIGFALALLLGFLSLLLGVRDYRAANDLYQARKNADNPSVTSRQWVAYNEVVLTLHRPPSPWLILSKGLGERYGSVASIRGGQSPPFLFSRVRFNFLLPSLQSIDFAFLVLLVITLMAVFLSADVLVAERESGTMQLTLAGGISRFKLLCAEWAGIVATFFISIFLLALMAGLFLLLFNVAEFGADMALRLALLFLAILLTASCFSGLGLWISASSRQPGTALVAGFFAWVLLIAIYPNATVWVGRQLQPLEPVVALADENTLTRMIALPRQQGRDLRRNAREAFSRGNLKRARLIESMWLATPFSNALISVRILCGTGLTEHERFLRQTRAMNEQLLAWRTQKLRQYPDRENYYNPSWPALDVSGLPQPAHAKADWKTIAELSASSLAILVFWNLFCFVGAQYFFAYFEVQV